MNQPRPLRLRSRDHGASVSSSRLPNGNRSGSGSRGFRPISTAGGDASVHPQRSGRDSRCRPIRQTVRARYGIDCHHRRWQETPPERIQRFVDVRDELEPVARWVRIILGLGTRRYVERRIAPGEEYLIAGHTERQQNEILLEGDPSSPIAPRDGSRSHGSGGQCS